MKISLCSNLNGDLSRENVLGKVLSLVNLNVLPGADLYTTCPDKGVFSLAPTGNPALVQGDHHHAIVDA